MKIAAVMLLGVVSLTGGMAASRGIGADIEQAGEPKTHEVRMVLENGDYRFVPHRLSIRSGDRVRFLMVSGAPHNVAFEAEHIPERARARMAANMTHQISPLAGPLLTKAGESYEISFAGIEPGEYPYFCMPHVTMDMNGTITVRP